MDIHSGVPELLHMSRRTDRCGEATRCTSANFLVNMPNTMLSGYSDMSGLHKLQNEV
jgi:hypothetical protein